jgi:transposase
MSESDRQEMERWVSAHRTPQQVAQRCRIILAATKGQQDKDIAEKMQINVKTVALWRHRFSREGPDCLWEVAAGRGRKPQISTEKVEEIIHATLQTRPLGATHWSCRTMAEQHGVSKATINRIW